MTNIRYFTTNVVFCTSLLLAVFSGLGICSSITDTNNKEVIVRGYQNLEALQSYHMTIDGVTSLSFQGKNMNVLTKGECDIHLKPMMLKNSMNITLDSGVQQQQQNVVQYIKEIGNQYIVYSNINNQWIKQFIPNYHPLKEYDNYFKAIKTVTVIRDLPEARVYEVVIDSGYLKENMQHAMASTGMQKIMLFDDLSKNLGDFTYTISIDKKTSTISQIDIDLTNLFSTIGNNIAEGQDEADQQKTLIKNIVSNMKVSTTMRFSQFNNVNAVLIPQEALDASTELAEHSSTTMLKGLVDVNKIMKESSLIQDRQERLNQKGQELSEQLKEEAKSLTEEEFKDRQKVVYQEFSNAKLALEQEVHESIKQAITIVVKEKKLRSVMYKTKDVAPADCLDITSDVMETMR